MLVCTSMKKQQGLYLYIYTYIVRLLNYFANDQGCESGSGIFAWIRIRIRILFSNFSGSGSGFQISLDPDPVSAQILEQKKKRVQKGL